MIRKNLHKLFLYLIFSSTLFAGTLGKSHSAELLSRGRSVPMAMSDNVLVTAKTFSSLSSRILDVYLINESDGDFVKSGEIRSPNPMAGDDFGFSIALTSDFMLVGAPGFNNGHGAAFLYQKNNQQWELNKVFENPIQTTNEGFPHKFGYSVALTNDYLSISSPFYNDGLVYVYRLDDSNSKISTNPIHSIDVRKLGNVEGCYAEGPDKFGFGISTSFNNNKLLIGSLKDFVHLIEYKEGIPFSVNIPNPINNTDQDNETVKFGESVYVGNKNIYISALSADNGRGKVFIYPFLNTSRTDENPWTNPYSIQPSSTLENAHFGYKISEKGNKVSISTFNQKTIYNYQISKLDKLELVDQLSNTSSNGYFGRNVILANEFLLAGDYYANKFHLYSLDNQNRFLSNSFSTAGEISSIRNKVECVNGFAGQFACNEIDLMSFSDKTEIGGLNSSSLNDIWGWTDPQTNKEYALVGMSNGTSFVDISNPENPIYLGILPTQTSNSTWRDLKVYQNHVFIVSEASGHGMQVFDLTQLRNYDGSNPATFSNTAFYSGFGNAHNIFINEDTGYAYAVGTSTCGPGGLHIVDISTPSLPSKSACVSDPNVGNERGRIGYNHDVQCVVYNGPDTAFVGKEICFGSTENSVWIADLSTKSDDSTGQKTIGIGTYDDYYSHQGWLTEDHKYFITNDELDEYNNAYSNTRTLIWNVEDLSNPTIENTYFGPTPSIDHNNYIIGDNVYMSHYTSGLRVLDISNISAPSEAAFFDNYPASNNTSFDGTWSNYPFYPSGVIALTSIDEGLFVVNPKWNSQGQAPSVTYAVPAEGSVTLSWKLIGDSTTKVNIYRSVEEGFTPGSSNFLISVNYPGTEYSDSDLDVNTFYYYKLTVEKNGEEGPFSNEIKVKPVIAPNQAPTIDTPADITFNEDTNYDIVLTGISYGDDVNPQNLTISASAENDELFSSLSIDYDPAAEPIILSLEPAENKNGSSVIEIIVKDDGGVQDGGVDSISVSFNATVNPVNDSPSSFGAIGEYLLGSGEYLPGTDFRTLYITPENVADSIKFVWEPAQDVDGDNVQYRMIGYQGLEFLSMTTYTSDNFKTWALKDLIAQTDTVTVAEGAWNVIATDGQSFKTASAVGGQLRVDGRQLIPDVLEIKQSYPNPFTAFTIIEYDVPSAQNVVIRIFNIRGQLVKTLINEDKSPGYYSVVWDGTNDNGDEVSSGVYFCQMYTPKNPNGGQFVKAKKMVKIR